MKTLIEQIWDEEYKPATENVLYGEEIMNATRLLDKQERELWEALGEKERLPVPVFYLSKSVSPLFFI